MARKRPESVPADPDSPAPNVKEPVFYPADWTTLTEAVVRFWSLAGKKIEIALVDINQYLRSGQLRTARRVGPDGAPTFPDASYWESHKVRAGHNPAEGAGVEPYEEGLWLVRRADLDWCTAPTPVVTAASTAAPHPSDTTPATTNDRRKPGPKIKHDWRLEVAVETHRFRKKEERTPTAAELAQFCYNKWKWAPEESEINKLLKYLLND